jgi:hypothetical protein
MRPGGDNRSKRQRKRPMRVKDYDIAKVAMEG